MQTRMSNMHIAGGPRFVAADPLNFKTFLMEDGTKPVPPGCGASPAADGTKPVPPGCGASPAADGTKPVPPGCGGRAALRRGLPPKELPSRKRPSRNSVKTDCDNRSILLFVSVNASGRQRVFDNPEAHECIVSAWREARNWLVGRYVIMPDHVHFYCSPGEMPVPDFHKWMKYWKSLVALSFPVAHARPLWQRQCWDVQLRTGENFLEKWNYIRMNPVRKGLADCADDWPYQGEVNVLSWHDR